jgi:hypothetical protein
VDTHPPDSPLSRLPALVLIWDDEPEAQAASKAEFVEPPRPGLMLAPAIFDVRVIDYGVQVLDWD